MTHKEIHSYLEAFWRGESTLEQEAALKSYFEEQDIPAAFKQDQPYFEYLLKEQARKLNNPAFDQKLIKHIGGGTKRLMWTNFVKMAAGLSLLIAVGWWYQHSDTHPEAAITELQHLRQHTVDADSQAAYELAREALLMLSKGISQDSTQLQQLEHLKQEIKDFDPAKH